MVGGVGVQGRAHRGRTSGMHAQVQPSAAGAVRAAAPVAATLGRCADGPAAPGALAAALAGGVRAAHDGEYTALALPVAALPWRGLCVCLFAALAWQTQFSLLQHKWGWPSLESGSCTARFQHPILIP